MIDIALIREKPDWVKAQIAKLYDPVAMERIDTILELDKQRRALIGDGEATQAARNKLNKAFGALRGNKQISDEGKVAIALAAKAAIEANDYEGAANFLSGSAPTPAAAATPTAFDELLKAMGGIGARVEAINEELRGVETKLEETLLWIPNLPHDSVPVFENDSFNIPTQPEGAMPEFDFTPKPHWELAAALDIIDFDRGVKLAGSRGYVLKGLGARLQRALIDLFLDNAREHGFTELYVPNFVKEEAMIGAGQFPKFRDAVYYDEDADVFMLPTAEVAITGMHRDEILEEAQLPLYYAAHTPCLRRERLSAGRDVRGIKRVHQFEKVELYKFTSPETSYAELESLIEAASDIPRKLKLPFRRLEIVSGDLGFSAAKKYDLEIFAAGSGEWLEVSSCSNTEDFQARRSNIKYRPEEGKRTRYVHTLNGSGLATPRVMIAIMENYQQADGSVVVPEALRPYMGGLEVIRKA
ncbi:MAG: serine--tRNA ligase [Anaerolineae bacterium]